MRTDLEIDPTEVDPETVGPVAREISRRLRSYPYFVRLTGPAPTESRAFIRAIARAIAHMEPVTPGLTEEARNKVSFTQVRINPDLKDTGKLSTAYSRTHNPLELHTDSSFQARPHTLVAFQMVRADKEGGDTVLITADDILDQLPPDSGAFLHREIFPFGRHMTSVFWKQGDAAHIRYYRAQIDETCEKIGLPLDDEVLGALDALDAVLKDPSRVHQFHLAAGETVFLHNTRVLHGRTGFGAQSDRLMYRFRVHAGCLG